MASIVFDAHAFVMELTHAGMPEQQAEVLARTQATLIDETLATKQDLKELELRLKHDLTLRLGSMMVLRSEWSRPWRSCCRGSPGQPDPASLSSLTLRGEIAIRQRCVIHLVAGLKPRRWPRGGGAPAGTRQGRRT